MPNSRLEVSNYKLNNSLAYPGGPRRISIEGKENSNQRSKLTGHYYQSDLAESITELNFRANLSNDSSRRSLSRGGENVKNNKDKVRKRSFDLDWIDTSKYRRAIKQTLTQRRISTKSEKEFPKFNLLGKKMQSNTGKSQDFGDPAYSNKNAETILFDIDNVEATNFYDSHNLDGQMIDNLSDKKKDLPHEIGDYYQLDEPILTTLLRDLSGIYQKMRFIVLPLDPDNVYKVVLRGWDLWGPLMLCTFLAFALHDPSESKSRTGPHFSDVFVLIWFGSGLVSLNYRLLSISSYENYSSSQLASSDFITSGENTFSDGRGPLRIRDQSGDRDTARNTNINTVKSPPSILQLMCVFGYCLVAPSIGTIILKLLSIDRLIIGRIFVGLLFGFLWPTICAIKVLIRYQEPGKKALSIYPIGLFYFVLSSMIILN